MSNITISLQPGDRVQFIGCDIIFREACRLAAESPLRVDVTFLQKGLHDLERTDMQSRLQATIDAVPAPTNRAAPDCCGTRTVGIDVTAGATDHKAILLGYARCNDGLVGLTARHVPLVIPKAHDCITFFFGSRREYKDYFDAHPGTYYHTVGWLERGDGHMDGQAGVMKKLGLDMTREEMIEKYGQEEADYLLETLGGGLQHYDRYCYLEMGVTDESRFIAESKRLADEKQWLFDRRNGDLTLLRRLLFGQWNDDFLIIPPGHKIVARNDDEILDIEPAGA